MDIEQLRIYCLSLPLVTEDMPFGDTTLVFRVRGRIFALTDLERPTLVSLKCDPELAIALRERHEAITGAYHMNKKHWNQVALDALLPDEMIESMVRHSYGEVVKKLTRRERTDYPELTSIDTRVVD